MPQYSEWNRSILTEVTSDIWIFLLSRSEASNAKIAIIANFVLGVCPDDVNNRERENGN